MRIGIEIPLDRYKPEPELTPSPVAEDRGSNEFMGFFYRVVVEALEEWANVTNIMKGGLGFSVELPEITSNFRYFREYVWKNWEKRILRCTKMLREHLKL